jgi:hypothetical protein
VCAQQNDAGTGGDAGSTPQNATEIDSGTYTGMVDGWGGDHYDYYKFYVENGTAIKVRAELLETDDPDLHSTGVMTEFSIGFYMYGGNYFSAGESKILRLGGIFLAPAVVSFSTRRRKPAGGDFASIHTLPIGLDILSPSHSKTWTSH